MVVSLSSIGGAVFMLSFSFYQGTDEGLWIWPDHHQYLKGNHHPYRVRTTCIRSSRQASRPNLRYYIVKPLDIPVRCLVGWAD